MINKKLNSLQFVIFGLIFLLGISACSTKKNTWSRRAYHNVVCHYNVYWNGSQSLKEGEKQLQKDVVDNYSEVLRVYNYGLKKDATKMNPKMDRTIKKASIGIQKNSMYFGGREYIKWVRRSYLMMGEAHFLKQDYTSARRVFDYVSKEYENDPIRFEGYLWLAKTYIQTERYQKAEATLNFLQSRIEDKDFPASVKKDMLLVFADFYIAQKNYYNAYPYLERSLEQGNKRYLVTRTQFILAQINQLEGDLTAASEYYKKVIKRNPDYKMDFQARINLAKSYDEGTGDSKHIYKVLKKMVKDFRNKEFLDEIYYALAEIAFKDGDTELGIGYLQKSVSNSTTNKIQKTTSSLELADIYFNEKNYKLSQAYYDTAVSYLPDNYPDASRIKNKASVLKELIEHVQTIELQDSLQTLARMDSLQLYALIDNLIAEHKEEKKRLEKEAEYAMDEGGVQFVDMDNRSTNQSVGGKWYFYNTNAMSQGYSEFVRKWGNRKLEDNWFINDKRSVITSGIDTEELENEVATADSIIPAATSSDPENRLYYLASIPRTPEQLKQSTELIIDAYNSVGYLYLEELNDTANAKETYLTFQEKYPDNQYRLQSWYALYKIFTEEHQTEKANYYKNLITSNYPDSDYAQVILDPDFFIKQKEQKGEAAKLYERAYEAYTKNQYYRVITYADKASEDYSADSLLMPKFMYLKALSVGRVEPPDSLFTALSSFVSTYPRSELVPQAKEILKVLQRDYGLGAVEGVNMPGTSEDKKDTKNLYTMKADALHLFVVVLNQGNAEVEPMKVRMSDFKKKYFDLKVLRIKSLMLDNQRAIITVGNFENASEAADFMLAFENDDYVLSGLKRNDYEVFTISVTNYPILYREKDVKGYLKFFKENYSDF